MLVARARVPESASMLAIVIGEEIDKTETSFLTYDWNIY